MRIFSPPCLASSYFDKILSAYQVSIIINFAHDYWWGFNVKNERMVHTINSIRFWKCYIFINKSLFAISSITKKIIMMLYYIVLVYVKKFCMVSYLENTSMKIFEKVRWLLTISVLADDSIPEVADNRMRHDGIGRAGVTDESVCVTCRCTTHPPETYTLYQKDFWQSIMVSWKGVVMYLTYYNQNVSWRSVQKNHISSV